MFQGEENGTQINWCSGRAQHYREANWAVLSGHLGPGSVLEG